MVGITRAMFLMVGLTMAVSACGRKGALETPPPSTPAEATAKKEPGVYRPFILDPLVK